MKKKEKLKILKSLKGSKFHNENLQLDEPLNLFQGFLDVGTVGGYLGNTPKPESIYTYCAGNYCVTCWTEINSLFQIVRICKHWTKDNSTLDSMEAKVL